MKLAVTIVAVLAGLLSIAAGGAKIALVPDEVAFLGQFGFTGPLIIGFGVLQVVSGILLFVTRTRFYGAVLAGLAFATSAALLVSAGSWVLAAVSVLPLVATGAVGIGTRPKPAARA